MVANLSLMKHGNTRGHSRAPAEPQHPQDGLLIQHLAHEAQGHVEAGREETFREETHIDAQFLNGP